MKRLFLTSIFIIIFLFSSCQTEKDYSSLKVAEGKKGLEAAEIYQSFLSSSEDEKVRWNYVYSLYEAQEFDLVLTEIENAVSLYPENIRFLYLKSLVYRETGNRDQELSVLEEIRDINPGNIEVRKRLLNIYSLFDQTDLATEEAKAILRYENKNLDALEYLALDSVFYERLYDSLRPKEITEEGNQEEDLVSAGEVPPGESDTDISTEEI